MFSPKNISRNGEWDYILSKPFLEYHRILGMGTNF
jgi:hypothetical protein